MNATTNEKGGARTPTKGVWPSNFDKTSMTSLSTHMTNMCTRLSHSSTQFYAADFNLHGHQSCRQTHAWQAIVAKRVDFSVANLPQQCIMCHLNLCTSQQYVTYDHVHHLHGSFKCQNTNWTWKYEAHQPVMLQKRTMWPQKHIDGQPVGIDCVCNNNTEIKQHQSHKTWMQQMKKGGVRPHTKGAQPSNFEKTSTMSLQHTWLTHVQDSCMALHNST
jgi:hypothetical protein